MDCTHRQQIKVIKHMRASCLVALYNLSVTVYVLVYFWIKNAQFVVGLINKEFNLGKIWVGLVYNK